MREIRRIRANVRDGEQEGCILHQKRHIPVIRMIIVRAVRDDHIRPVAADIADEVFPCGKRHFQPPIRVIQHIITRIEQAAACRSLTAPFQLQLLRAFVHVIGARASIRHRKQAYLPACLAQLGKQAARICVRIIRMRTNAQNPALFFHIFLHRFPSITIRYNLNRNHISPSHPDATAKSLPEPPDRPCPKPPFAALPFSVRPRQAAECASPA